MSSGAMANGRPQYVKFLRGPVMIMVLTHVRDFFKSLRRQRTWLGLRHNFLALESLTLGKDLRVDSRSQLSAVVV